MSDWTFLNDMSAEDIQDMKEECRADFRVGTIDEKAFRRRMARLGLIATEIDAEVKENEP